MLPKLFIVIMLAGAIAALTSAALAMLKRNGDRHQMARALTWRVGLSVALFVILLGGFASGLLTPRATPTVAPVDQTQ
jgi:NADH:ubiquinone oxidoreductase subunit 6 (subunit J)